MIYFGRHPLLYGSQLDEWMVIRIGAFFESQVRTAKLKDYTDIVKLFDMLCDCNEAVFRPYKGLRFDKYMEAQIRCLWRLQKPVWEISREGHIVRLTSLANRIMEAG